MRGRAALLALLLLLGSCSRRARLNPLDSGNPESGGAPIGFNALADYVSVRLVWTPRPDLAIDGFQLFRLAPLDSLYRPLGVVESRTSSQYLDTSTNNGSEYLYRLYYIVNGARSATYAEDVATPGPVRAWVVDSQGGRLLRLTPDARDVRLSHGGFGAPFSLAVTPDFGPLWVSDFPAGVVHVVSPENFTGPTIAGVSQPFSMALDPLDGSAWICDLLGSVHHYHADGQSAGSIPLLQQPSGIATHASSGELWVCENSGDRVRVFDRDRTPLAACVLPGPSRVAVDSTSADGWVTSLSTGWVWCVSNDGVVVDSLHLSGPIGVALDWRRRTAWIADAVANQLVAVDMDTRAVRFRVSVTGEPRDVDVDRETGEAWVVARLAGRVSRYSPAGVLLGSVGGLGDPYEVRLDRGFQ